MATYVNDLRLKEIATGDESGTWGTSTNTNLELIAEAFSFGTEAITTNADTHTTTIADGSTDPGRSLYLKYTGTLDSACTITIGPNTVSKLWFIENGTSGSQNIIISQGSGANVTVPAGEVKAIYSDGAGSGAAMVDAFANLKVSDAAQTNITSLGTLTTLTVDDITINGSTISDAGNMDFDIGGDLTIDVDGADIKFADGGTEFADHFLDGNDYKIQTTISNGDFIIVGNDGGSAINALTLDMSSAGAATFNGNLTVNGADVTITSNIIHAGDTNTFFGFNDADTFRIVTGGSEALRVDSNQRVGINTSSPDSPLEIDGGSSANTVLHLTSTTANTFLKISDSNTNEGNFIGCTTDDLTFFTRNSEKVRIDSSGRLLVASSTAVTGTTTAKLQINGTDNAGSTISIGRFSANANAPTLQFIKSRNGSVGSNTVVQDGDNLGQISFAASDGSDTATLAAKIFAEVDGTPGSNDMPGRLTFFTTADGASSPTERVRIANDGSVLIGTTTNVSESQLSGALKLGIGVNTGIGITRLTVGTSATTVFDLSDFAPSDSTGDGLYMFSLVRNAGSFGTRFVGILGVDNTAIAIVETLESLGFTISVSGMNLQASASSSVTCIATLQPLAIGE